MSEKIRIAVLASGGGTNLQALIDAEHSGIIKNGEIVLVICNRKSAYAAERAKAAGIRAEIVTRKACPRAPRRSASQRDITHNRRRIL